MFIIITSIKEKKYSPVTMMHGILNGKAVNVLKDYYAKSF